MNQVATINQEQNLPATLDRAQAAIALASKPEEINQVLAMMGAAVEYAKRLYKGQNDVIQRAKSLQIQAERKLGEILRDMPKATGLLKQGAVVPNRNHGDSTPTLAEIGIDKKTSARAQKLAALPEEIFAEVKSGKITVAAAIAPAPKPEVPVVIAEEDDGEDDQVDFVKMSEDLHKQLENSRREIESLNKDDSSKEISRLSKMVDQLNGLVQGHLTTIHETKKTATYQGNLLKEIRLALGVETNKEILQKLRAS